ncbi:glycosyltransferase [Bacillus sp. FJAT-27245]|uniref:glycosyltransferase n=1 Tax=Bacillus sp. FJAT-27245 TaxID=1684144 RepID=UPI0006A7639F|nr:glycosyltransferase [Bacillus sp. FJAT-27245]
MKVLIIDVNYKFSSTGKIVHDLYTNLNRDGHSVRVCYGRGSETNDFEVYKFSNKSEVYAHALLTRLTGKTGNYSRFSTKKLLKLLEDFNPDVVHIHELHGYFVNISPVINYLKEKNIKTIWTFHCEFMYTGKCGYAYDCNKWKTECGKCPRLREYPASLFFDFTKEMFNEKKHLFEDFEKLTIVTPSNWLADRTRESFLGRKDIRVIHNGIDTNNVFFPREVDHLKIKHNIIDEKIVLAAAPDLLSNRKGGRWVIELAKRMKDQKVKFILIGVEELDQPYEDNIIALGKITNQHELAEYYSLADIFIICSEKENFPTTCIESLACGTPIIGFDEGGTRETAPDGYGIFVPYGDLDLLETTLNKALVNRKHLKSKQECSKYGSLNYSKDVMYKKYLSLYLEEK